MSEALTDASVAAGVHVVTFSEKSGPAAAGAAGGGGGRASSRHVEQILQDPLQLAFAAAPDPGVRYALSSSGLAARDALPPSVHLLTLKWLSCGRALVRLSHMFEADEHPALSGVARVDLHEVLGGLLTIERVTEATLFGERELRAGDAARPRPLTIKETITKWDPPINTSASCSFVSNRKVGPIPRGTEVTLHPMQIRAFYVTVKRAPGSACPSEAPPPARPVARAATLAALVTQNPSESASSSGAAVTDAGAAVGEMGADGNLGGADASGSVVAAAGGGAGGAPGAGGGTGRHVDAATGGAAPALVHETRSGPQHDWRDQARPKPNAPLDLAGAEHPDQDAPPPAPANAPPPAAANTARARAGAAAAQFSLEAYKGQLAGMLFGAMSGALLVCFGAMVAFRSAGVRGHSSGYSLLPTTSTSQRSNSGGKRKGFEHGN